MKTTKKRAAFLFALLIPILFVGCKSKPIETLPLAIKTHDASNPFVGVWVSDRVIENKRGIFIFTYKRQWASYIVNQDGKILSSSIAGGYYTFRGSNLSIRDGPFNKPGRLIGDELKIHILRRPTVYRRIVALW